MARQENPGAPYDITRIGATGHASNPAMDRSFAFGPTGMSVGAAADELDLKLRSIGCDGATEEVAAGVPSVAKNRMTLTHARPGGDVDEWYVNGPMGVEQGFTLAGAFACAEERPLVLDVTVRGLTPRNARDGSIDFVRPEGAVAYHYTDMRVVDAGGRELPGHMEATRESVRLVVDARGASYPLVVDPLVWTQQAKLLAPDGDENNAFGFAVAVSGTTAIVGASNEAPGATGRGSAYVFVQKGTTWALQQELIAPDPTMRLYFGAAVAVDGETAVVTDFGGYDSHGMNTAGAAYVYARSGTAWTLEQSISNTTGEDDSNFDTVSLSGTTLLMGSPRTLGDPYSSQNYFQGSAYVFAKSGGTWTLQQELMLDDGAEGDQFGYSVGLDGDTAVIGAGGKGAVYVFVRKGTTWTQQQVLGSGDGAPSIGESVAISGNTAIFGGAGTIVGAPALQSAAYVFVRSGTQWTLQQQLTSDDGPPTQLFGRAVGIDGDTAVVGTLGDTNPSHTPVSILGKAYAFTRTGTTWSSPQRLMPSDAVAGDQFGATIAISGQTVLVGAQTHRVGANANQGSAYIFVGGTNGSSGGTDGAATSGGCTIGRAGHDGDDATYAVCVGLALAAVAARKRGREA